MKDSFTDPKKLCSSLTYLGWGQFWMTCHILASIWQPSFISVCPKNGTESTFIPIFSGFRWRLCSMHLSRKLITFSLNLSYFVAKTRTSSAIFTTPSNPSTTFHIHFSKISVALLRPMARIL